MPLCLLNPLPSNGRRPIENERINVMLNGKRTYVVAGAIIALGIVRLIGGDLTGAADVVNGINTILGGLGLAFLRMGVASGPANGK
jgi:hypothetical protein